MKQGNPPDEPVASTSQGGRGEQLVERMLSGFGHVERPIVQGGRPPTQTFHPLRQSRARPDATYRLQAHGVSVRVHADSPALDVMTDLRHVPALTTTSYATVEEAHRVMVAHRVRALFVVDAQSIVIGIITSTDVLSEKPIQLAHQRGLRHDEVLVRDVMTPAELLEAMELDEVLQARVGDVVASLKLSERQHALVVESADGTATPPACIVRGIFSVTQIARQLGIPPQAGHNVARTFAEIEAAIGA